MKKYLILIVFNNLLYDALSNPLCNKTWEYHSIYTFTDQSDLDINAEVTKKAVILINYYMEIGRHRLHHGALYKVIIEEVK